jgi:hypothetical protein
MQTPPQLLKWGSAIHALEDIASASERAWKRLDRLEREHSIHWSDSYRLERKYLWKAGWSARIARDQLIKNPKVPEADQKKMLHSMALDMQRDMEMATGERLQSLGIKNEGAKREIEREIERINEKIASILRPGGE